jgi:serine/threonine protein kinase
LRELPDLAAVLGAERFVHEIRATAQLQHAHILPLFDSGEAEGFLYYVMLFISGETLREKLNREAQLSIEEGVRASPATSPRPSTTPTGRGGSPPGHQSGERSAA